MCTSIIAGKGATDGRLVLLARNEDFTSNSWNKYLSFRPHPAYYNPNNDNPDVQGKTWVLGNGLQVPVPDKMYSYSAMPDASAYEEATHAIGNRFYYEGRGINQCNVAVSATNSMEVNDKANAADPLVPIGIDEPVIPTLILPQAQTAIDAVKLLGCYVEKYGASNGNGILIGDPKESWYFEIGSGHHWIAVKVPEDTYIAVANSMRIHLVNLDDSKNVLCSTGLFEFVCRNNLLENPVRQSFDFAKAFGILGDSYSVDRIWLAQHILTPSLKQKTRQSQYPLFLKPDKKIHAGDVMSVLRATYKGTELEGIATRPIGVARTAESHIITLNEKMPEELKGIIWQTMGTPLGAPYIPFYNVMRDIPEGYFMGNNQYSPSSAYWSFRGLFGLGSVNNDMYMPEIQQLWNNYEQQFINEQQYLNNILIEMYSSKNNTAMDFARKYSTGLAYQLVGIANKEYGSLITKITNSQKDDETDRNFPML